MRRPRSVLCRAVRGLHAAAHAQRRSRRRASLRRARFQLANLCGCTIAYGGRSRGPSNGVRLYVTRARRIAVHFGHDCANGSAGEAAREDAPPAVGHAGKGIVVPGRAGAFAAAARRVCADGDDGGEWAQSDLERARSRRKIGGVWGLFSSLLADLARSRGRAGGMARDRALYRRTRREPQPLISAATAALASIPAARGVRLPGAFVAKESGTAAGSPVVHAPVDAVPA